MRINLEGRLALLDEEIAALEAQADILSPQAKVFLTFGGKPVLDSRGIQASFSAEAIQRFEQLVSTTDVSRGAGELDQERHRLFITGMSPDSFCFELEEISAEPGQGGSLRQAVEEASHLLLATQADDATLAEALAQHDPRVVKALAELLKLIAGASATLRVNTDDTECSFDTPEAIAAAADRAQRACSLTAIEPAPEAAPGPG